jgi:hypothetical protein
MVDISINELYSKQISSVEISIMTGIGFEILTPISSNNIVVPNMDDQYQQRSRRKTQSMKKLHHYHEELYYTVINLQLKQTWNVCLRIRSFVESDF